PGSEDAFLVDARCAAFGAGNEGGAELGGLRAERERGGDAGAVHDAARRDDRQAYAAHEQAHEGEGAGHGFVRIAQESAAMAAGFGAVRHEEVDTERREPLRFRETSSGASDARAESLEPADPLHGNVAQVESEH